MSVRRMLIPKGYVKDEDKPQRKIRKKKGSPVGRNCSACGRVIGENDMAGSMKFAHPKTKKLDERHCHITCMSRVLEIAKRERVNWFGKDYGPAGQERNKTKKLETADEYMRRMAVNANKKITFVKHD